MTADPPAAQRAFDRVGAAIESRVLENPVLAWMRETNRRELLASFAPGSRLLEIGCGTGADAEFLADRGYRVVATDVSGEMVSAARRRVAARGLDGQVSIRQGRVFDLGKELRAEGGPPLDGAYANFSLTYEESLRDVAAEVASLCRPQSVFVFTLPNRLAASVPALALIRGRPREVLERWRADRYLDVRGIRVRVRDYRVGSVRSALTPEYALVDFRALPAFMPSSFLYDASRDRWWRELRRLDDRWDRSFPWRHLGETTWFRAVRRG